MCQEGFSGEFCEEARCPKDCNGNGICMQGQCLCLDGFSGETCEKQDCPNMCSGNGICLGNGLCECKSGYSGNISNKKK